MQRRDQLSSELPRKLARKSETYPKLSQQSPGSPFPLPLCIFPSLSLCLGLSLSPHPLHTANVPQHSSIHFINTNSVDPTQPYVIQLLLALMVNNSPKVTLFAEPRAGVKPRQAGCRTTRRASSMPHESSGAAWRQEPMGTVAGRPLLASPGGGPPLPELPCKGTPADGGAVANLQSEFRRMSLAPRFW